MIDSILSKIYGYTLDALAVGAVLLLFLWVLGSIIVMIEILRGGVYHLLWFGIPNLIACYYVVRFAIDRI